jgi:hypothetical protein
MGEVFAAAQGIFPAAARNPKNFKEEEWQARQVRFGQVH